MKNRYPLGLMTALAAVLALSSLSVVVRAEDGAAPPSSSQSSDVSNVPTPEEARAALMTPVSKQPSTGDASDATTTGAGTPEKGIGAKEPNGGSEANNTNASAGPPPSGPIGSVGQTIPAKFSRRNDILDHVPIMAWPLPLSDQQRKQIYDAVTANNSQPVVGAETLKPASELSPDQALNGMHPLPTSVRSIDGVSRLYYVKAKGKILLIEPATRTVVGEITS